MRRTKKEIEINAIEREKRAKLFIQVSEDGVSKYFEAVTAVDTKTGIMLSVLAIMLSLGLTSVFVNLSFLLLLSSAVTIVLAFLTIGIRNLKWGIDINEIRKVSAELQNPELLDTISAGKEIAFNSIKAEYDKKMIRYRFTECFFILTFIVFFILHTVELYMPKQQTPPQNPPPMTTIPVASINLGEPSPKPQNPPSTTTTPVASISKGVKPSETVKK